MAITCAKSSTTHPVLSRHACHTLPIAACRARPLAFSRHVSNIVCSVKQQQPSPDNAAVSITRRTLLATSSLALLLQQRPAHANDFVTLPSGLKVQDIRPGEGASPQPGDTVVVHWAGFTKGYQGKRIDNTSIRDEPYEFVLGRGQAIKAFEEAVSGMQAGGIRRIEVPGDKPELGYAKDRKERFTDELISPDLKIYKYRVGPQPSELGGQRALDFVLDNSTLQDFNRTLLFDIKLLAVRKPRS